MSRIAKVVLLPLILATAFAPAATPAPAPGQAAPAPLGKPGQKLRLDAEHTFVYGFTAAPKLGPAIMRVEIFDHDGKRDTKFTLKGDLDMPSMRGAHSTGPRPFQRSNKGVYLLPVELVMPGGWEFKFTFEHEGKQVLEGTYPFEL